MRGGGKPLVWVVAGLAVATTAATFGGWGRSGSRMRSSYELVDVADRAGVLPDRVAALAAAWFLVPALCGIVLIAVALDRGVTVGAGATTLGALVGVGAILVLRSPLAVGAAAIGALGLGACTAASGTVLLVTGRARGR